MFNNKTLFWQLPFDSLNFEIKYSFLHGQLPPSKQRFQNYPFDYHSYNRIDIMIATLGHQLYFT